MIIQILSIHIGNNFSKSLIKYRQSFSSFRLKIKHNLSTGRTKVFVAVFTFTWRASPCFVHNCNWPGISWNTGIHNIHQLVSPYVALEEGASARVYNDARKDLPFFACSIAEFEIVPSLYGSGKLTFGISKICLIVRADPFNLSSSWDKTVQCIDVRVCIQWRSERNLDELHG